MSVYENHKSHFVQGNSPKIIDTWADGIQTHWKDGTKKLEETQLFNSIIIGFIKMAYKEKEKRSRENNKHRSGKKKDVGEKKSSCNGKRSRKSCRTHKPGRFMGKERQVLEYLEAVKSAYMQKHGEIEPGSEIESWLKWAMKCAERLNPLSPSETL